MRTIKTLLALYCLCLVILQPASTQTVGGVAAAVHTQTVTVTVSGKATGMFGNPASAGTPLVAALTVTGPGTITVSYVSGTVNAGPPGLDHVGPNGYGPWDSGGTQYPLQEKVGLTGGTIDNLAALFGVFVPQSRVEAQGFYAIDGTKGLIRVGIMPGGLFFIGTGKTFSVTQAGTLFLGINDNGAEDNGGAFTVMVTGS